MHGHIKLSTSSSTIIGFIMRTQKNERIHAEYAHLAHSALFMIKCLEKPNISLDSQLAAKKVLCHLSK